MLSQNIKKKILIILLILAVVLLAVNITIQQSSTTTDINEINLIEKDISQRFRNILTEFGIEDKFIKETTSSEKLTDREISKFRVQVPNDLSIPEILLEVSRSFIKDSLNISTVEKVKGGRSILKLKSGNVTFLQADFDYSKKELRNKGLIAFIIYDFDLNDLSAIALIESPTRLNFLIRPETTNQPYLELISKNEQEYSVLIDDDITEQKYKLDPGYSEQRVITVLKSLITDFQRAAFFVVDNQSDFYNSPGYKLFKKELLKRKIKVFTTSDFYHLNDNENSKIIFNEEMESLVAGDSVIFLLDEDIYLALNPEIVKCLKKGYKVVFSSLILQ